MYSLLKQKKQNELNGILEETSKNKESQEVLEFNHSYYQGLLLSIGNLKGYKTFAPNQDKNKKFLLKTLNEVRTLTALPSFSYQKFIQRSSTVDVIWFNEREMPHSFFEVEHSTDIQNSILKFNDLQDFYSRMVIVADKSRKLEYENKIKYSSFKDVVNRVGFLDYESLNKQYEQTIEQEKFSMIL